MTLYIRPVHRDGTCELLSYAICRQKSALIQDGDILTHCERSMTGKDVRETAEEFYGETVCEWGAPINV